MQPTRPPPAILVSCLLPWASPASQVRFVIVCGPQASPQDGSEQREPGTPSPKNDTHSKLVHGCACAQVMRHNEGGGPGEGPQSPAPCLQGQLLHEGGGPLEARNEHAADGPGHMQGLRMQPHLPGLREAPGFCSLLHILLSSVSFRVQTWIFLPSVLGAQMGSQRNAFSAWT